MGYCHAVVVVRPMMSIPTKPKRSDFAGFSSAQDKFESYKKGGVERTEPGRRRGACSPEKYRWKNRQWVLGTPERIAGTIIHPTGAALPPSTSTPSVCPKWVLPSSPSPPPTSTAASNGINTSDTISTNQYHLAADTKVEYGWATSLPGAGHLRTTTTATTNNGHNQDGRPTHAKQKTTERQPTATTFTLKNNQKQQQQQQQQ